ncbi:MAG: SPASM domain-containing protein [Bacteroidetes bacterium]|nr:SPASM domain-containing protein [Bacteroidota bacterium]
MRLSKQLHTTKTAEGWRAVYSPFGHNVAFIFDEAWDFLSVGNLSKVNQKIVDYLIKCNILVENGFEKNWIKSNIIEPKVNLNSMYLIITQNCNLGCKYCAVVENYDSPSRFNEKMSLTTGIKAIELFEKQLQIDKPKEARVTFYGGEPMMNHKLMIDLVPRIRSIQYPSQKKPVEIILITNGYKYNDELVKVFSDNNVGVCISLDGDRKHQDITRVTRNQNKSTFDKVISNFRKYKSAGLSMGISTAIGAHNIDDLIEICEFYVTLDVPFVEFQIPYQVANESNALWVSSESISKNLMNAYVFLRSKGIIEGTTYRRLRDFSMGKTRLKDCGSSGRQIVVAPDGTIGPCHSLVGSRAFFDGNVMDNNCDPKRMGNFLEWANRYPFNMPECHPCPYISLCGGGCIYNSYVTNKSIWGKDIQTCKYMAGMINWILHDLWQDSGMASKYGKIESVEVNENENCIN